MNALVLQNNIEKTLLTCQNLSPLTDLPTLIAVTKTVSSDTIKLLPSFNIYNIAESRVQEAVTKKKELMNLPLHWHMIGPLQKNKAKKMVQTFDTWHSLASVDIALAVHKHCLTFNKKMSVFVQVNIGCDPQKKGFLEQELPEALPLLSQLSHFCLIGFMTILPQVSTAELLLFKRMKTLALTYFEQGLLQSPYLSMGMSRDYKEALQAGATHIRIGRGLFSSNKDS